MFQNKGGQHLRNDTQCCPLSSPLHVGVHVNLHTHAWAHTWRLMHALTMIWGISKTLEIGSPPLSNSIEKITLRPKKKKWYLLRQKVNLWISLSYKVWWIEHISRLNTGSATFIDDNHVFAHLRISLKNTYLVSTIDPDDDLVLGH